MKCYQEEKERAQLVFNALNCYSPIFVCLCECCLQLGRSQEKVHVDAHLIHIGSPLGTVLSVHACHRVFIHDSPGSTMFSSIDHDCSCQPLIFLSL